MKTAILVALALSGASADRGAAPERFPFSSVEILTSHVDADSGTGYAILTGGRFLHYKRWLTEDASALEATLIDTNKLPDRERNWHSDEYIRARILWLSKLVLNERDNRVVVAALRERKYDKKVEENGEIVYTIPGTNYSEFYFAVRQPGDAAEEAAVKVRYVLTL
jgi:hypothetical protein